MMGSAGDRRADVLRQLRGKRSGLTIDELAGALSISRTAIRQHLSPLERDGLVATGSRRPTSGRPVQSYCLTEKGWATFPSKTNWFSERLLEAVREERGSVRFVSWLQDLAGPVAASVRHRLGQTSWRERVGESVRVLNEMGFEAAVEFEDDRPDGMAIVATHCVLHGLASRVPEVCQFDLALIGELTRCQVRQEACIVQGADTCRFRLEPPSAP